MTEPRTNENAQILAALDGEIAAAKARYAEAVAQIREACEHLTLLEAPYEASLSGLFAPMRPLRICDDCGLEEEGWSFRVLRGRAYPVSRNDLYRARKGGRAVVAEGDRRGAQVAASYDYNAWD